MRHLPFVLVCCLVVTMAARAGAAPVRTDHIEAELVSEFDAVVPGSTASLGLRLVHDPHWHTYWQVPGDAGLPTQLNWKLAPGYTAGAIQWPLPRLLRAGPLANYGYEGSILLPVEVAVPGSLSAGSVARFVAHADWLVCNDICIPGGADLDLSLPVRGAAQPPAPSASAAEFGETRARVPQPVALAGAQATRDGSRVRLTFSAPRPAARLAFFPLEAGRIQAAAPQPLGVEGDRVALDLSLAQPAPVDFKTLHGVLVADGGPGAGTGGWAGTIAVALRAGVLPPAAPVPAEGAQAPATVDISTPSPGVPSETLPAPGLLSTLLVLAGAFVGGLILNLMPCVFPVLSLKLLSLVQHRTHGGATLRAHGLAFAGGAILSFVALAALLVALRAAGAQIGWGFQLQTPVVVALLTALFFLIGLNLLGAFEFTFGAGLANTGAARRLDGEGLRGSFATGVLAVAVASPCTAPFMGAALGFAATQPAPVALAVFAILGAGMATPYLVLTMSPGLLARLPRPGAWMERFKQVMAFPMFVTCVWLLWVLAQQIDIDGTALVLAALVAIGLAAWAAGVAQRGVRAFGWVGAVAALVALVTIFSATGQTAVRGAQARTAARHEAAAAWADWSPAAQQQALARRQPVFVDFTAAWCVTCQANKRLVLYSDAVGAAFEHGGVALMRADWTNRNEPIARELARFRRDGVPLYVLYDRGGHAQVLPEILTQAAVLDALARL